VLTDEKDIPCPAAYLRSVNVPNICAVFELISVLAGFCGFLVFSSIDAISRKSSVREEYFHKIATKRDAI